MTRPLEDVRRRWPARHVPKAMLMPALAARVALGPRQSAHRRVLAAQGLSWAGDLALIGQGRRPFLAGLTSFLAAHTVYISAYRARSGARTRDTAQRRGILATGAAAAGGMAWAASRRDPVLALPVAVYGTTLAAMVATAAAVDADRGRRRILTGSALFLLSDLLIGVREFVGGKDSSALQAAVMATYATGQWCIADGMTRPSAASALTAAPATPPPARAPTP